MKLIPSIRSLSAFILLFGVSSAGLYSQNQGNSNRLQIEAIASGELADIVAISGGMNQGIERGMLLSVFREGRKIGELLVTRTKDNCSAALITEISPNESFEIGDRATPKVRTL